jgi:cytochrome b6-f complex iron-sulfur subunit
MLGVVLAVFTPSPLLTPWDVLGIEVAAGVGAAGLVAVALRARGTRRDGGAGRQERGRDLTRRRFLEQGALAVFAAALVGLVTSAVDYVVTSTARTGRIYRLGSAEALRSHLRSSSEPYYDPVGGFYLVAYPAGDLPEAERVYRGAELSGMQAGFVALDQACTHDGCRVPFCRSSQWFECPCDGSRYNAVGELRAGPAPRGLDRYEVRVEDAAVVVDTARKILGPPPGTDTTAQRPAGPHCN